MDVSTIDVPTLTANIFDVTISKELIFAMPLLIVIKKIDSI
jgi:hypothetical protein